MNLLCVGRIDAFFRDLLSSPEFFVSQCNNNRLAFPFNGTNIAFFKKSREISLRI